MANERTFVTRLMESIEAAYPDAFVWKPADGFNLGVPDIHAVLPKQGQFLAAEVKKKKKLFKVGEMMQVDQQLPLLDHCFSGPQISMLRRLARAGAQSYGVVQTHKDIAYALHPQIIPLDGQVTPGLLLSWGQMFTRKDGWKFWK